MDKVNIFTVLFCRLVCFIWFLEAVSREMLLGRKSHENTVNADKGQMLSAEQFLTKKKKSQTALQENIYPHNKVVVLKASPRVIKLDPALMFKYVRLDGTVQLVHIQVELPAVLVEFCTGWWIDDGLTMGGHSKHSCKESISFSTWVLFT